MLENLGSAAKTYCPTTSLVCMLLTALNLEMAQEVDSTFNL
jgi:hypothetical protein